MVQLVYWSELDWTELGRSWAEGSNVCMYVRVCLCVWGSVVACIIGLATTW